ncbi:glycosyltransferase family 4 protein [Psychroflexus planctonicus]|uniref:Glycosyl transferase family 1 domain-containing protein n=1 Tax=Psychroflexus planctonicus TaxID=1526575 RepID=A0ABQ1SEZ2_9FLAO|nr:glycosyltransferase family 4 protein [Psychroflexus planctonicus]GGE32525.1 hypothetical protein GCM10010832_10990 [Psychroflexus planctonicus]
MEKKEKRKNILYLGNKLAQKNRNLTHLETLSKDLEKEAYQVKTFSNQINPVLRLLQMLWANLSLRNWYEVLLIDTYSTSAFWYAYLNARLARLFNKKYICILHGGNLPKRLNNSPKLCKKLFGKAYLNIAPSHYLLEAFQEAGYTNLKYIPNTIEIGKYPFQLRKKATPKLLYVRSFAHIYNPILALKVLQNLRDDFPDIQLSMVGPFKDESINQCKAFAEIHDLPVSFTGGMPKEKWLNYAKDFDIFINTTNVDNTPVSVIEAMALGLPVVTTNVGGIPYLLDEDEAMLVPPDNVDAMSEAIKTLIQSPSLVEKLSLQGRQKVEAFDWQTVKQKWIEIL